MKVEMEINEWVINQGVKLIMLEKLFKGVNLNGLNYKKSHLKNSNNKKDVNNKKEECNYRRLK